MASISLRISSSVKCLSEIAPVGHFELQRPSSFTENRIYLNLLALFCITNRQGSVGTGVDTCPAAHALTLIHLAHRTGSDDYIVREKRQDPARSSIGLVDRLLNELGIVGQTAEIDTVGSKLNRPQFDMGLFEEAIGAQGYLELIGYLFGCC